MSENDRKPNPDQPGVPRAKRNLALWISAWAAAGIVTLIVLLVAAGAILLHSQRFHNYVLTTVQQKATESLGVAVHLQNFGINLAHLDVDLYGLTVEGASPYASTHLLEVDHAEASARVISILHSKWYLQSFRVDRPIVRVLVDANGKSNIPTIKSSGDSSNSSSIFDIGVRHAIVDRGEVYYNDKKSVLTADLHELNFRASFDESQKKYSGNISYTDGHLVSGSLQPIPHNLQAEFDATPTTFHLTRATLSAGASQVNLSATVQNYNAPVVDAKYEAIVDGAQIGKILKSSSIPQGQVRASGQVHYKQLLNRPLLDAITVSGDVTSDRLDVSTPSVRTHVTNLSAHYTLANSNANVTDLKLNLLGGQLTGNATMTDLGGESHSRVEAKLRQVSLDQLKHLAGSSPSSEDIRVAGGLSADVSATWGKTINDLVAKADATIHGQVSGTNFAASQSHGSNPRTTLAPSPATPVDGTIHGSYSMKSQQLELTNSSIQTPQTTLTMNGKISDHSSLDLRLQAADLRELESIADIFRKPTPGQPLQPLGLEGNASFHGTVQGSITAPHLDGQFIANNLHAMGSQWRVIRTSIEASPESIRLQHADLEPMSRGHINLDASVGLRQWSFSNTSPIEVSLDASQLDVAELAKLSGQQVPVRGTLSANVKAHGTELNPIGSGSLSVSSLVAYDQPVSSLNVKFAGTGDEAHADLAVQLPSGSIQSTVAVRPKDRTYTAQLKATGIQLDKLQALKAHNVEATGEVALNATGQGSFDNPQLDATLSISTFVVQKQSISGFNLKMNVANHVANATLASSAVNTNIQAKAKINLTGDYLADATLDTQAIPFQPLIAIYAPDQAGSITGETELHAVLHGPLKDKNKIEAHVTIPTLKLAYGSSIQLAAASPIHVDYKNGIVDLQRASIKGTDTDLQFQGSIPLDSKAAPTSVMLLGTVNLQLAQLFDPDVRTSGEVKFNINSTGTSNIGGQVDIVNATYSSADLPIGLQNGNGTLTLSGDRLSIAKFQGKVGGGTVTAQGGVSLRPSVQFDIGLQAQGIRMLYPQGMREGIDANVNLAGSTDSAVLGGSISLTDLSFTNAFDLNGFISQFTGGVSAPPTPGLSQNIRLNLNVRSSNDINLVSRTLSIDGSANLQVRGTAANPVILGRVNLNNGDIILNGDRFVLNWGTVQFVNPSETEPVLNVSLKTTIQQYDVYLRFNGPIDQLRTNYNSDPALPSADIINLLAFGKTTEADTANPSTPTNQAAAGLVASQVSSQVTSRVSKIAGISQLSINPVLAGGTSAGPQGANITIQQRVTGNLFVTFSSNVASTQSQTIQGQYQLSPRVALSATRDQNGGFAFDALIKKTW
jgi:translocation and assembly module TamB